MEAPFVIKFIETKWHDKQTLVSVSESKYSPKLEQVGNNAFPHTPPSTLRSMNYVLPQLAIKLSMVISYRLTLPCPMAREGS